MKKLRLYKVNIFIVIANILFIYFWGYKGWGLFEKLTLWKFDFDSLGHLIFGLGWGYFLVCLGKLYWPEDYLVTSKKRLALEIILIVTAFETLLWEICIEWLLWDSWLQPTNFSELAKAQKGIEDTMLDILITFIGACLAMLTWGTYRKYFEWRWPDDAEKEEIDEEKERGKIWANALLIRRKEHQKQILKVFFGSIRTKIKDRKAKNTQNKINLHED